MTCFYSRDGHPHVLKYASDGDELAQSFEGIRRRLILTADPNLLTEWCRPKVLLLRNTIKFRVLRMIGVPPVDLDQERLTHFVCLSYSGPDEERALNLKLATRVAAAAGLTLLEAIQSITSHGKRGFASVMDEYLGSDGFKSMVAAQERIEAQRRSELLAIHGDPEKLMEPSALESRLREAVSGYPPYGGDLPWHFRYEDLTPALRGIFSDIDPVHSRAAEAIVELEEWNQVHRDRRAFFNYDHDWWIDGRRCLLEHGIDTWPARNMDDVLARLRLWQLRSEAGVIMSLDDEVAFRESLIADIIRFGQSPEPSVVLQTTTQRSKEVFRLLRKSPELSNREIARRVGVSPQTVANSRGKIR